MFGYYASSRHRERRVCSTAADPENPCMVSRMAGEMFGWEMVYKLIENDISKKEDVLVALLHWYLIKQGFKCIGIGDSKILTEDEKGSETLPNGWNQNDDYSLRYLQDGQLFILKGTKTSDDILFNLLRTSDLSVSAVHFKPEEIVENLKGSVEELIPSYKDILQVIKNDLLEPVMAGKNKEATTQTAHPQTSREHTTEPPHRQPIIDDYDDPLRIGQPRRGLGVGLDPNWDRDRDPFGVGRSDLDPLGRGGGGMVFNPFGRGRPGLDPGLGLPGGLPRGSVPPGARFDPFGPPDINPRPGRGGRGFGAPDPDHLPPPGYDDMFM